MLVTEDRKSTIPPSHTPIEISRRGNLDQQEAGSEAVNLRQLSKSDLVEWLIDLNHTGASPRIDECKALVCIMVRDSAKRADLNNTRGDNLDAVLKDDQLPWPPGQLSDDPERIDNSQGLGQLLLDEGMLVDTDIDQEGWADLIDSGVVDGLFPVLQGIFSQLDSKKAADLAAYIVENIPQFKTHDYHQQIPELFTLAYAGLDKYSDEAVLVGKQIVDLILSQPTGLRGNNPTEDGEPSNLEWYLANLNFADRQVPLYRALIQERYETQERDKVMGLLFRASSMPAQLNVMRQIMDTVSGEEKTRTEALLREVLGVVSGLPVYTDLNQLYAAVKFENYPLSLQVEDSRTKELSNLLRQLGVNTGDSILDLGSGTGWLVNGLLQQGFNNVQGLDVSDRNVAAARGKYGDHFIQGSWYEIPLSLKDQKVIISKERSLPHTEEESKFFDVLAEVAGSLADDGLFIFDMPDPTKGTYKDSLGRYRDTLKRFAFSEDELSEFWYIVDSPDGKNFYNRFVPSRDKIIEMLSMMQFEVVEEIVEQMPDENQNMVFVCRKAGNMRDPVG